MITTTQVLHGLAYVGVYILNVLIYETIAVLIWLPVSLALFESPNVSEKTSDLVTCRLAGALCIAFGIMCILLLCGIGYIVPLPTFK